MPGHVIPGQDFAISAQFYNETYNLLKQKPRLTSGGAIVGGEDPTVCRVRNSMGVDLPLFGVVGLGDPLIDPAVEIKGFLETFAFNGVSAPQTTMGYKWGLTLEPIAKNKLGWVRVSGLCHCWIDLSPDQPIQFAGPDSGGGFANLVQANCGARVIYRAAGSGPQRGVIIL